MLSLLAHSRRAGCSPTTTAATAATTTTTTTSTSSFSTTAASLDDNVECALVPHPGVVHTHNGLEGFQAVSVRSDKVFDIKQEWFAAELKAYKDDFERPILSQYLKVHQLMKGMSNRRARAFRGPAKRPRDRKMAALNRFHRQERKTERFLHDHVEQHQMDTKPYKVLYGRTEPERIRRELWLSRLMKPGSFWEPADPAAPWDQDTPPPGIAGRPHKVSSWEMELSDVELGAVIGKQLEYDNVKLDWGNFYKGVDRRGKYNDDRIGSAAVLARKLAQGQRETPVEKQVLHHPAYRRPDEWEQPHKATKMHKVSDEHPIAFETTNYPLNPKYDPSHFRKSTMIAKLSAWKLSPAVRRRLEHLLVRNVQNQNLRTRYDPNNDILYLTSRNKATRAGNKRVLIQFLRVMIAEAMKADLNFIPPPEAYEIKSLEPHHYLDWEEYAEERDAKIAYRKSFDRLKEQGDRGYTLFRLFDHCLPDDHERVFGKLRARALRMGFTAMEHGKEFEVLPDGPSCNDFLVVASLPPHFQADDVKEMFKSVRIRSAHIWKKKKVTIGVVEFFTKEDQQEALKLKFEPFIVGSKTYVPGTAALLDGDKTGTITAKYQRQRDRGEVPGPRKLPVAPEPEEKDLRAPHLRPPVEGTPVVISSPLIEVTSDHPDEDDGVTRISLESFNPPVPEPKKDPSPMNQDQ